VQPPQSTQRKHAAACSANCRRKASNGSAHAVGMNKGTVRATHYRGRLPLLLHSSFADEPRFWHHYSKRATTATTLGADW